MTAGCILVKLFQEAFFLLGLFMSIDDETSQKGVISILHKITRNLNARTLGFRSEDPRVMS